MSPGSKMPSSVAYLVIREGGVRSTRSSFGRRGSAGAIFRISEATSTGTLAFRAAFVSELVPTLFRREPSRKTVSAPRSRTWTVPTACSASSSATTSVVSPAAASSSANARPSPPGSETVQTTRPGPAWASASRAVAEAEWVITTRSSSSARRSTAIVAAARSRELMSASASSTSCSVVRPATSTLPRAPAIEPTSGRARTSSRASASGSSPRWAASTTAATASRASQLDPWSSSAAMRSTRAASTASTRRLAYPE